MHKKTLEDLKEELGELKKDYAEAREQIKSLIIDRDFMKGIVKELTQKHDAVHAISETKSSGGENNE